MNNVEIIGIEQVHRLINKLPKEYQKPILTKTCMSVSRYIGEAALNNLSSVPGNNIIKGQINTWKLEKSPLAGAWVGWNLDKAEKDYKAAGTRAEKAWAFRGALWTEYGASGIGRHGRYIGKKYHPIQPYGWWRRAIDMNIDKTEKEFNNHMVGIFNRFLNEIGI